MNVIQEIAMLAPVVAIAAINISLYLAGERGTLLVPCAVDLPRYAPAPIASRASAEVPLETEFEEELRLAA
jgi:hypothetical protein